MYKRLSIVQVNSPSGEFNTGVVLKINVVCKILLLRKDQGIGLRSKNITILL